MTTLVTIAPNRQLASVAAGSYRRCLTDGMPEGYITSAYRSTASQEKIFLARYHVQWAGSGKWGDVKWYGGRRYVRNDSATLPVAVPGKSSHNKGLALDTSVGKPVSNWLIKHGARHGWSRPLAKTDPVHWEYSSKTDQDYRDQVAARATMRKVQKAIRVALSGIYDSATKKAAIAVKSANGQPPTFPSGKKYAQTHSGTKPDGVWGKKSAAANTKTVKAVQTALGVRVDGYWRSGTQADLEATARKAK